MSSMTHGSVHGNSILLLNLHNGAKARSSKLIGKFTVRASVASSPSELHLAAKEKGGNLKETTVRIGVLGASGYTGVENRDDARQFMKFLHPDLGIELPERSYGTDCRIYVPENPKSRFINVYDTLFDEFVLAHIFGWWGKAIMIRNQPLLWVLSVGFEMMEEIIKGLPKELKIVDLSADFRLRDIDEYAEWYGQPHKAPELQEEYQLVRDCACGLMFDSNLGAKMFDMEYGRWLDENYRHMAELQGGLQVQLPDGDLRMIVDDCLPHYDDIFRLKSIAAKSDVFHLINEMWKSPAERCFYDSNYYDSNYDSNYLCTISMTRIIRTS